jgi:hypothetical protein
MSSRKFRFVSPGIFLKEIDNSQIPAERLGLGPVIIGRTLRGPAFRPTRVANLEQLNNIFGPPSPGTADDGWRDGTDLFSDSYATYAAKCYLRAGLGTNSPVTIVRLLGIAGEGSDGTANSEPGWMAQNAYGLFVLKNPAGAASTAAITASMASIFYGALNTFEPKINGTSIPQAGIAAASGEVYNYPANSKLDIQLENSAGARQKNSSYLHEKIRNAFNTNPVLTNDDISKPSSAALQDAYWLGESWQTPYDKMSETLAGDSKSAIILKLASGANGMSDFKSITHEASAAHTGWFVGQSGSPNATFDVEKQQRLFRLVALSEGFHSSKELIISIENLRVPRTGEEEDYATFTVIVNLVTAAGLREIERFENCDLNASSPSFIASKIGDQYVKWDSAQKRNKKLGRNRNRSAYIRVQMNEDVTKYGPEDGKATAPVGYLGPIVPADITGTLAVNAGSKSSGTFTGLANFTFAGANGSQFRVKTVAQPNGLLFELDKTVNKAETENQAGGATAALPLVGTSDVADNDREGLAEAVQLAIADSVLGANLDLSRTGHILTITQKVNGAVATIAEVAVADDTHFEAAEVAAGSSDDSVDVAIDNWVADTMNLTNFSLHDTPFRIKWPDLPLINHAQDTDEFRVGYSPFKVKYDAAGDTTPNVNSMSEDHVDLVRIASAYDSNAIVNAQKSGLVDAAGKTKYSYKFSLEDVILTQDANKAITDVDQTRRHLKSVKYSAGSKKAGTSYSALVTEGTVSGGSSQLNVLFGCVRGYYVPMVGGSDGVDITESDPFNNRILGTGDERSNYAFASVDRAISLIKDPETVEHNLAAMPGITNEVLTSRLVSACEARADSLAIIDLPNVWVPSSEQYYEEETSRMATSPRQAADDLVARRINSSYGATYYPWVVLKDDSNREVPVPPSVAALGVMANTERKDNVWFAPAGFNRAGLKDGAAGMPVSDATERLLSSDRDTLYQSNINPIASFVGADGIVIFGQKTLQSTRTALDRINVRRLLIFIKKEISRISKQVLFQPNVQATWDDFLSKVTPFLNRVKIKFGLTDFKVVLDSSTTTDDLIDRNIMYAKVFIKPARAIEFIAVDFIITRTGSSFVDPLE